VIEQETDAAVGVLDEAFVAEYGQPGTKFIVRGTPWMMQSIRGDKIFVKPISDPTGAIPSWVGEEIPVPQKVASEVGAIRRKVGDLHQTGQKITEIAQTLSQEYPADSKTFERAISETYELYEQG